MTVRGAPAIAIAAALSLAVELRRAEAAGFPSWKDASAVESFVRDRLTYLVTSRPTAVNLQNAATELSSLAALLASAPGASAASVADGVARRAEAMLEEDVAANRRIGDRGSAAILAAVRARERAGLRGKPPKWAQGRVPADLYPSKGHEEKKTEGKGAEGTMTPSLSATSSSCSSSPSSSSPSSPSSSSVSSPLVVLTHCNTGSLATAGYGTALGVLRSLYARGSLSRVVATETRPYWQGARLTAYELAHDGIPASLIPDGAAAAALLSGRVDAVVVGADRVSARGDVANKVGTLSLALAARAAGVPFFVAAPLSTVDVSTPAGGGIKVELRSPEELTHVCGHRVAADGVDVWNPSFDVTPAELVAGIITEHGTVWNGGASAGGGDGSGDGNGPLSASSSSFPSDPSLPYALGGEVDVAALVALVSRRAAAGEPVGDLGDLGASPASPAAPRALSTDQAVAYVLSSPLLARHVLTPRQLAQAFPEDGGEEEEEDDEEEDAGKGEGETKLRTQRTGGAARSACETLKPTLRRLEADEGSDARRRQRYGVTAREVGDGNINFVFEVRGPGGALCLKQALPYVRMVGEAWPLSQGRLAVEHAALVEQRTWCPAHVPEPYWFDESLGLLAMRWVEAPAVMLRAGIVAGAVFPRAAAQAAAFCAETHYGTSYVRLGRAEFEAKRRSIDNVEMRELTQQVVFTDPYYEAEHNRHSAGLDDRVRALRADPRNAAAAAVLKAAFMHAPEALVHGDLHTGSLMATDKELYVIDPEFAFYGPIAFEVGKLAANFLLAAFAVTALDDDRKGQRDWLLAAASEFCILYFEEFAQLFVADARKRRNGKSEIDKSENNKGETNALPSSTPPETPLPALTSPRSLHHLPAESTLSPSSQVFADSIFASDQAATTAIEAFLRRVERDAVGFAGAVMVRRLIGIAHLAEFERIQDTAERTRREAAALEAGLCMLRGQGIDENEPHPLLAAVRAQGPRVVDLDGDDWDAGFWER